MNVFISFFRDVLDGPVYIVVATISIILIFAGIGYFAEKKQKREEEQKKFDNSHISIQNDHANIPTGSQTATISDVNATNSQNGVPENLTRGKVESKVVPEVLTQTSTTNNQNISNNNTVYNNQTNMMPNNNMAYNNQPTNNYNNANTNINTNNNFTN